MIPYHTFLMIAASNVEVMAEHPIKIHAHLLVRLVEHLLGLFGDNHFYGACAEYQVPMYRCKKFIDCGKF